VQHCLVADGAIFPDRQRAALIGVHHRVFLHIGPLANADHLVIAAQGRAEPDRRAAFQHDLANDIGVRCDPEILVGGRFGGVSV
jgi:hypothetical protein